MFVCLSVIYESLDIDSSFLVGGDFFAYEGHRVKVKVTEAENANPPFLQCKTLISNNSGSTEDTAVMFSCSVEFSAIADRIM